MAESDSPTQAGAYALPQKRTPMLEIKTCGSKV